MFGSCLYLKMLKYLVFLNIAITVKSRLLNEEGQCLKFQYDAHILERIIRIEFKLEDVQETVTNSMADVNTTIRGIKDAYDDYVTQESAVINAQKEAVGKAILDTQRLQAPTIAFSARGLEDHTADSLNVKLVFTHVMYNHGGGYDNSTGVFTAPVNGTYMFTIHLCPVYDPNFHIVRYELRTDSENGHTSYFHGAHPSSSASAVVVLVVGQGVWVTSRYQMAEDDDNWNVFSGTVLHV